MFKFDLKKIVLYTSVGAGCIALLIGVTAAPLDKILPGGHVSVIDGSDENEVMETAADGGFLFSRLGSRLWEMQLRSILQSTMHTT